MNKLTALAVSVVAFLSISPDVSAFSSMKNAFGKGSNNASATASPSAEELLVKFRVAQIGILSAQMKLTDAYELKEQTDLLSLQIEALQSTALDKKPDMNVYKKSIEVSGSALAHINKNIEENKALSPQGKKLYAEGVAAYVIAVKDAYQFLNAVKSFGTDSSGSGLLGKAKGASTVIFITKDTPVYLKNFFNSTKLVFATAKKNKIEVPKDATAMLDG